MQHRSVWLALPSGTQDGACVAHSLLGKEMQYIMNCYNAMMLFAIFMMCRLTYALQRTRYELRLLYAHHHP